MDIFEAKICETYYQQFGALKKSPEISFFLVHNDPTLSNRVY